MSAFKAIMHRIRFPCWGSLQHSPRLLAVFKGPTSKGREMEGEGKGREGVRRGGFPPIGESVSASVCEQRAILNRLMLPMYGLRSAFEQKKIGERVCDRF